MTYQISTMISMWYTDLPTILFTAPACVTFVTCVRIVIHSLDQVLCPAQTSIAAWFFDFFRAVFCGIWIQGSLEDIPAINFHPGSSESDEYSLRYCAHKNRGARYTEFEMTTVLMKSAVNNHHPGAQKVDFAASIGQLLCYISKVIRLVILVYILFHVRPCKALPWPRTFADAWRSNTIPQPNMYKYCLSQNNRSFMVSKPSCSTSPTSSAVSRKILQLSTRNSTL